MATKRKKRASRSEYINQRAKRSDYIVYLMLMWFLSFIRILPRKLSRKMCLGLGRLAYRLDKKHRKITIDNLTTSFPEKSGQEILDISKKVFENLGAVIFDLAIMPKINQDNYRDYFEIEGEEYVQEALKKKKGILFISAHLCNWEMLSAYNFLFGEIYVLAKTMHNRYTNDFIIKTRKDKNVHVIETRHTVGNVIKLLRAGKSITTLIDQSAHRREAVDVDFFGRPAMTGYFMALLALKLDICIIPMFVERIGEFKYRHYYLKPVEVVNTGDRKKDLVTNTQAFTKVIEDEIRKRPGDWLWVHNRWK